MAVSKNNVLFVYRDGDPDSFNLAIYYQQIYDLDNDQLLGIPCSDNEILLNYSVFEAELENPIKAAIASSSKQIWIVILGYNVPGGFYDNSDVISSTSRISRINHTYSKQKQSSVYNMKVFSRYDSSHANKALIVSRIDAPTYENAKNMISKSYEMNNQAIVNGRFFYDIYSSSSSDYINDLTDFYVNSIFDLNMKICSTTFISPYIDVVFPYLQHDSFYWGWSTDRTTESFFKSTDTERIFFYNADFDSAITVRSTSIGNFCPLAIANDYISVAGAMSNPGDDGFLRPRPFFESLYQGATLGEAYLFSNPYYDWTISFFGDPLVRVIFYSDPLGIMSPYGSRVRIPEAEDNPKSPDYIDQEEINREITIELSQSVAYHINKENQASNLFNSVLLSTDVGLETSLLYSTLDVSRQTNSNTRFSRFYQSSKDMIAYIRDILIPYENGKGANLFSVNDYLSYKGLKLSRILLPMISNIDGGISENNLYNEGYWELDHVVSDITGDVTNYNFVIQISKDSLFSTIELTINSSLDKLGWYYEIEEDVFSNLPLIGFPYNYIGRRVRYQSTIPNYLERAEIYYFRIVQTYPINGSSVVKMYNQIIYT